MPITIYILKLEHNKYYIGKSKNPELRLEEHKQGLGSAWTRKYKPISILETIENASPFDEDKQVKIYMSKYGIENVRGGTYITEVLTEEQHNSLKAEIWGSEDLCNKCGRKSHFYKDCYANTDRDGNTIEEHDHLFMNESQINEAINSAIKTAVSSALKEAFSFIMELQDKPKKKRLIKKLQTEDMCNRCKRTGHQAKTCYAKTDSNGKDI